MISANGIHLVGLLSFIVSTENANANKHKAIQNEQHTYREHMSLISLTTDSNDAVVLGCPLTYTRHDVY